MLFAACLACAALAAPARGGPSFVASSVRSSAPGIAPGHPSSGRSLTATSDALTYESAAPTPVPTPTPGRGHSRGRLLTKAHHRGRHLQGNEISAYLDPCVAEPFIGLECLIIREPFYLAFVAATWYGMAHEGQTRVLPSCRPPAALPILRVAAASLLSHAATRALVDASLLLRVAQRRQYRPDDCCLHACMLHARHERQRHGLRAVCALLRFGAGL